MRILVTGHLGYIGPVVTLELQQAGHQVVGLDSGLFAGCRLEDGPAVPALVRDLRDVQVQDLAGFDALVHLAGLSNDPLGTLDPAVTHQINVEATVRLAELAREARVARFLSSSSCSIYGAAAADWVDETTPPRPVTAYGLSKQVSEQRLAALADETFCVASLRNATAFGYSPYLRTDLVVNDLVAGAYLHGEIRLNSDGSAWRPLVHVRDIAQAFLLALTAPAQQINRQVFNVGADAQNYTVMDIARAVAEAVPGARLTIAEGAGPDRRSYRVRFERIGRLLPRFRCQYDLQAGIRDLQANFRRVGFQQPERFVRLHQLQQLLDSGRLDRELRFTRTAALPA